MRDALPLMIFIVLLAGAPFYLSKGSSEAQMRKEVCGPNTNYTPTNKLSRESCAWTLIDFETMDSCKKAELALNSREPSQRDADNGVSTRAKCFNL